MKMKMKIKLLLLLLISLLIYTSVFADNKKDNEKTSKHIDLKEVTINASRLGLKLKDIPGKVEIIDSRTIENTSASNLAELLKKTTGVDIVEYPGMLSGISMRGFSPGIGENNYTVILIDGIPAGTNNIATISLNNIKSIEILKGPYSSLYGSQAMGGIINIITKTNTGSISTNLNLTYGSYNKGIIDFNVGGNITEKLTFRVSAQKEKQNSDYKVGNSTLFSLNTEEEKLLGLDLDNIDINNSTYTKDNFDAKLAYSINDIFSASINYSYFKGKNVGNPGSIFSPMPTIKNVNRHNTSLILSAKQGNHLFSVNNFFSTDNSENFDGVDDKRFVNLDKEYRVIGTQISDVISLGKKKITLGVDYKKDDYKSKRWDKNQQSAHTYNPDYYNSKLAAYAQANLKLFDERLNISTGVRADIIKLHISEDELLKSEQQTEKYNEVNYNIGVRYNICKNLSAYSSFGTAFLSPTALQMTGAYQYDYTYYWDGVAYTGTARYKGNTNLNPEQSKTFELGLNYYKGNFSADLTWFNTNYENKIVQVKLNDDQGDYDSYSNAKQARMSGFETEISYDFRDCFDNNFSIQPYLKWTYLYHAKQKEENEKIDILYVKKHNALFGLRLSDIKKFDSSINFKYAGKRKEMTWGVDGSFDIPAYMTIDISSSYKLNDIFKFGIEVNNLLDERYGERYGYILSGRNFNAKISMLF